ncbi:MAG: hypothetical protein A2539_09995 [Elusimicrobia bacterium RIFOXYD2_FULL_34_15]|nr:MAG: hypothetical protein A2539_09995 [Elusimicrobia bacterium RIFOXYD2_FULL_34_15]
MKVAIIHDWLTGMRGGEKCLEVFCELFPEATVFTLLHKRGSMSKIIENMEIRTSFLQKFPNIEKRYRYYLPLMPIAIKQFNLQGYDLILSSSHCVAKGIKIPKGSLHICYCYTPMRYVWDMYNQYFDNSRFYIKYSMKWLRKYLQKWDVKSSVNVHHFIAISEYIRERIKKHYNRDSLVIYPPVDTIFFKSEDLTPEKSIHPYYLVVSSFAPYKKIDLAIEAFNKLGYSLKIIGNGQDEKKLRKIAKDNIEFLGWRNNDELRIYYNNCKALIFPSEEDFGIVPVEAQSMGRPVIAYKKGGSSETIVEGVTGIFFEEQNVSSLIDAVKKLENMKFNSNNAVENARGFNKIIFKNKIKNFIDEKVKIMYNI